MLQPICVATTMYEFLFQEIIASRGVEKIPGISADTPVFSVSDLHFDDRTLCPLSHERRVAPYRAFHGGDRNRVGTGLL